MDNTAYSIYMWDYFKSPQLLRFILSNIAVHCIFWGTISAYLHLTTSQPPHYYKLVYAPEYSLILRPSTPVFVVFPSWGEKAWTQTPIGTSVSLPWISICPPVTHTQKHLSADHWALPLMFWPGAQPHSKLFVPTNGLGTRLPSSTARLNALQGRMYTTSIGAHRTKMMKQELGAI